jgi:hypothetical protein
LLHWKKGGPAFQLASVQSDRKYTLCLQIIRKKPLAKDREAELWKLRSRSTSFTDYWQPLGWISVFRLKRKSSPSSRASTTSGYDSEDGLWRSYSWNHLSP